MCVKNEAEHVSFGFGLVTFRALFDFVERLRQIERECKILMRNNVEMKPKMTSIKNQTLSVEFGEVLLKTGVRLRYAEQGNPEGQPIIMLHGFTDSRFSFSRVLPLFSDEYHIFAIDQRGHGNSDRSAKSYKLSDFAADVVAFMDAKNLERATVIGHSMGSFIALQTAIDAPQRVEKLVLIGSATTVRNDAVLDLQKEVNQLTDPVPEDFVREFQLGTTYQPLPNEFIDKVVKESMKLPSFVWREALAGLVAVDYKEQLNKIKAPALIIWGEKDAILSRSEQDVLAAKIETSELKIYSDVGHAPHWECSQQVAEDIKNFLGKTAKR